MLHSDEKELAMKVELTFSDEEWKRIRQAVLSYNERYVEQATDGHITINQWIKGAVLCDAIDEIEQANGEKSASGLSSLFHRY